MAVNASGRGRAQHVSTKNFGLSCQHISYNIIQYHIISIADLKWQKLLKVGTDKPKLEVTMQSVSDDDVRKRLLEKPRFELAAKGVFRLGRCCIFRQCVPGLWASNWESALRIRMTEE